MRRSITKYLTFLIAIGSLACQSASLERHTSHAALPASGERCHPVTDTVLVANQTVDGLEGRYRLILVKSDSVRKPNGVFSGFLSLWRTSPNDSSLDGRRPISDDRSTYFGSTDIDDDAAELAAHFRWKKLPDPKRTEIDPIHPPVLGSLIQGNVGGVAWQVFSLKVGTSNNRRDREGALDGLGGRLEVRRIHARGFFGFWGPNGIVKTGTGHFCAYRLGSKAPAQLPNTR